MNMLLRALLLACLLPMGLPVLAAEEPAKEPARTEPEKDIERALDRKVTFEFVDTPLNEVLAFFRSLTNVNFVADRVITEDKHNPAVNLRVADMSLKLAMGWVCKLSECEWEIKDNAVHVFVPKAVLQEQAEQEKTEREHVEKLEAIAGTGPARKLRVRFSDGTEVEAEGAVFDEQPELARNLLDRALDPARDGVLAYRIDDAEEAAGLLARLARLEPKAKGEYVEAEGLLFLMSDEAAPIHKAAAFMRKLGHYDVEVDGEQQDPNDDEDVQMEKVEEELKPALPPQENPATAVNF